MSNTSNRGRNNGNYHRDGGSTQMSSGRGYCEQTAPSYPNQSTPYYQQQGPTSLNTNVGYSHTNNRHSGSAGSRQRVNSNRSSNSRSHNDDYVRSARGNTTSSNDMNDSPISTGKIYFDLEMAMRQHVFRRESTTLTIVASFTKIADNNR
jgi:hypothetical protein